MPQDSVRLLTPFDPVVWDRTRFEYYGMGLPLGSLHAAGETYTRLLFSTLLWRDRVIGWGNLAVKNGELHSELGYIKSRHAIPLSSVNLMRK